MLRFTVVGGGHVGRVLGRLFSRAATFAVQDVVARSMDSAVQAQAFIGAGAPVAAGGALRQADVYMLTVSDDQIVPACEALAAAVPLQGAVVFHCSGALASDKLAAARAAGAQVASVHPIRSFADMEAVAAGFAGTFCGVEGDQPALDVLLPALAAIGGRAVQIDPSAKTVYHAAAVFASNYLVTVIDAALRAYQAAGIPESVARELARPLALESMENAFRLGAAPALTGPIARGDMATVQRQHDAVAAWDKAAGRLYESLVPSTVALAERKRAGKP